VHCRTRPPAYDRVWAAYQFEDPLRSAIHRFKYGGESALGEPLGALLAERLVAAPLAVDLILAVPLHVTRFRERGYNQSQLLARVVARRLGRPLTEGLVRIRPTMPQVGQNPDSRRANVAGAFAWQGEAVAGRHLVLVDDVCTTGATFDACAQALRPHRPASIVAVALARA
jgi:ComF family protein